ncbi:hypothetical protein BST11_08695 [Mycobacterium alsense]|uniref:Uncharacterized protein n=1 Tax=Mycobacterium alsense TaxID=324058 RepID=A0ABX3RBD4_9MYCO|nr:hypothetical protein BST11_08695 [Mycobacterium alsense]
MSSSCSPRLTARLGNFLRDRGVIGDRQPVGGGIEGVADVDDDLELDMLAALNVRVLRHLADDDSPAEDRPA